MKKKTIVKEFKALFEEAQKSFNVLKDVPQYGRKHWRPFFAQAFTVYTKLWKFQKKNREILNSEFKLKRSDIGDIASKIAQLYYHYYLRTSDYNSLLESFIFYEAIRKSEYFVLTEREQFVEDFTYKKFRYYARFIVVCLLLNFFELVKDLKEECKTLLTQSSPFLHGNFCTDWMLLLNQLDHFLTHDRLKVSGKLVNLRGCSSRLPNFLLEDSLKLKEVILISNKRSQNSFSELSLDLFYMLQVLEQTSSADLFINEQEKITKNFQSNPHKYMLYRPDFATLFLFISAALKELNDNTSAVLLYFSTEVLTLDGRSEGLLLGGNIIKEEQTKLNTCSPIKELLYPEDLLRLIRKPTLLILDIENVKLFNDFCSPFSIPILCISSGPALPLRDFGEKVKTGSTFTWFLSSPLEAVALFFGIREMERKSYELCDARLLRIYGEIIKLMLTSCKADDHDSVVLRFIGDNIMRLLICRFVFFNSFLKEIKKETQPMSNSDLLNNVCNHPLLLNHVAELLALFGVGDRRSTS